MEFVLKAIISGLLVASVSWLSTRNVTLAAVMMGIPFTAFLSLVVMYYTGVSNEAMARFSWETIIFVVLSLTFFVVFPIMILKYNFWLSMLTAFAVSALVFNIAYWSIQRWLV